VNPYLPLALLAVGAAVVLGAARALRRRAADGRVGSLEAVDLGAGPVLRSDRYRLAGRPDALRRRRDGGLVPVELKHRPAPRRGPFPSHVVQLGAYCLLVEEATGRPPAFGLLRYDDGDVPIAWDTALRDRVLATLARATAPYDGAADPSPAKCRGCVWSPSCDASQA
jgi:CRISPR-associated exonuclease Cas4